MASHEADHQRTVEDYRWGEIDHRIQIGEIALQEGLVEYYDWLQQHHYWEDEHEVINLREDQDGGTNPD